MESRDTSNLLRKKGEKQTVFKHPPICVFCFRPLINEDVFTYKCHIHSLCLDCFTNITVVENPKCATCRSRALENPIKPPPSPARSSVSSVSSYGAANRSSNRSSVSSLEESASTTAESSPRNDRVQSRVSGEFTNTVNQNEQETSPRKKKPAPLPPSDGIIDTRSQNVPQASPRKKKAASQQAGSPVSPKRSNIHIYPLKEVTMKAIGISIWSPGKEGTVAVGCTGGFINIVTTEGVIATYKVKDGDEVVSGIYIDSETAVVVVRDDTEERQVFSVKIPPSPASPKACPPVIRLQLPDASFVFNINHYLFGILARDPARIETFQTSDMDHTGSILLDYPINHMYDTVSVTHDGCFWVSSYYNHSIYGFDKSGKKFCCIGEKGEKGIPVAGNLYRPRCIQNLMDATLLVWNQDGTLQSVKDNDWGIVKTNMNATAFLVKSGQIWCVHQSRITLLSVER